VVPTSCPQSTQRNPVTCPRKSSPKYPSLKILLPCVLLLVTSITRNDIEQACAALSDARRIRPGLCAEDLAPITQSTQIRELRKTGLI
jgi:hypothetical protein